MGPDHFIPLVEELSLMNRLGMARYFSLIAVTEHGGP